MTIDKRPSGAYRIRLTENGRSYSVTIPYKPTQKEAYELIRAKIDHKGADKTFSEAYKDYIGVKSNILSPSTIRGYESMYKNLPSWLLPLDIAEIDNYTLQKLINGYAKEHSAKSTHNLYSLVLSVIRLFYPDSTIRATLPQKAHTEPYTPSREDVKKLLDASKETEYYVPLYLASLSCRCSEICALTLDDLRGDQLTINKALVRAEKGYVLKDTPKTDASYRTITLPRDLVKRIKKQGYIYKGYPQNIDKYLRRTLPKLNIQFFSVHKLRHFFCSYCHDLGYTDAQIKKLGGWDSDVFRKVYRHAMSEDEARKQIKKDFKF